MSKSKQDERLYRGVAHLASARVARSLNNDMVPGSISDTLADAQGYGEDVAIATLAASLGVSARIIRAAVEDMEEALMGL